MSEAVQLLCEEVVSLSMSQLTDSLRLSHKGTCFADVLLKHLSVAEVMHDKGLLCPVK